MLIGHFMKGQLITSGALTVCAARITGCSSFLEEYAQIAGSPAEAHCVALSATSDSSTSCYNDFVKAVRCTPIFKQLRCYVITDVGGKYNRTIVEYCCGQDSLIGARNDSSKECRVIRITSEIDADSHCRSVSGIQGMHVSTCFNFRLYALYWRVPLEPHEQPHPGGPTQN